MNPAGWLALAGAVVFTTAPPGAPARLGRLTGAGRLAVRPGGRAAWAAVPPRAVAGVAGAFAVAAIAVLSGPPLAVAAAAVVGVAWTLVSGALVRRQAVAGQTELLAAVNVLIAELAAGSRPGSALDAATATASQHRATFARAAERAAAGDDAGAVLLAAPATRGLGAAWRVADRTGAALTGILERVAADLAAAAGQRRAVGVALAGPRSSAAVLAGLPALGIALGTAMGAHPVSFLLATRGGTLVCCAGVLLDASGLLWMRRILRRAERT